MDDRLRNLIDDMQHEAGEEAKHITQRRLVSAAEHTSNKIIKKPSGKTVNEIKGHIKNARATKDRMRTVSHYLCDVCDKPIYNVEDGFIVKGNIYTADPTCHGGLIGNAFPESSKDGTIVAKEVKESVFCKICFFSALGIGKKNATNRASSQPFTFGEL